MIRNEKQHLGGYINMSKTVSNVLFVLIAFVILSAFTFWKLLPNGSVNKVQKETKNINNYMNEIGREIIR